MRRDKTLPGTPGWFSKKRAIERDRRFRSANRALIAQLGLVLLVLIGVAVYLTATIPVVGGLLGGGIVTAFATILYFELQASSGSAVLHRAGSIEELVHDVIEEHLPRGWKVYSGVAFDRWGDIDHVIVGDNRVIEVETKSTNADWHLTHEGVDLFGGDPTLGSPRRLKRARHLVVGARAPQSTVRPG